MVMDVAAGIIIASIPYLLIRGGWGILGVADGGWSVKIVGIVMILAGISGAFIILAASNS